jgi:hypothetical protein
MNPFYHPSLCSEIVLERHLSEKPDCAQRRQLDASVEMPQIMIQATSNRTHEPGMTQNRLKMLDGSWLNQVFYYD